MVGKIQLSTVAVALALSTSAAVARPTHGPGGSFHHHARDLVNDMDDLYEIVARGPLSRIAKEAAGHVPDLVSKVNDGLETKRVGESLQHRKPFVQPKHDQSSSHKPSSGGASHKVPSAGKSPHLQKPSVSGEVSKLVGSKRPFGDKKKRDLDFYEALFERDLIDEDVLYELVARGPLSRLAKEAAGHVPDLVSKVNDGLETKRIGESLQHRKPFVQPKHDQSSSHKPASGGAGHKAPSAGKSPHLQKPSVSSEVNKLVGAKRPFGDKKKKRDLDLYEELYERDLIDGEGLYELVARGPLSHLAKEAAGHVPDLISKVNDGLQTKRVGEALQHRKPLIQPNHQSTTHKPASGGASHKLPTAGKSPHLQKPSVTSEVNKLLGAKHPFGDKKKRDLSDALITYLVARALELEELD